MTAAHPLAILVLASCSTWLLLAGLIPLLKRRLLDHPNARSSHSRPIPRGGGLAFVVVSGLSWVLVDSRSLLWCLPLALIGLFDDKYGLPIVLRYSAQITTAAVLLHHANIPDIDPLSWLGLALVIGATAVINFTNFMDGLDGLVASCLAIVLSSAAMDGSTQFWPLVGALLGFLAWNWSPAKVFMGDAGSTFLGVVLVAAVFNCRSWAQAFGLLLLATPLLADAGSCVLRRCLARQSVFQAHRLHLYQRLHQAGWSHRKVSYVYIGATGFLALTLRLGGLSWALLAAGMVLALGLKLNSTVAVKFSVASVNLSRSPG